MQWYKLSLGMHLLVLYTVHDLCFVLIINPQMEHGKQSLLHGCLVWNCVGGHSYKFSKFQREEFVQMCACCNRPTKHENMWHGPPFAHVIKQPVESNVQLPADIDNRVSDVWYVR